MMDYRKAYGLPERYFLSLGRMVEKKNLATLVAAYARYAEGVAVAGERLKVKGNDGEKRGAGPPARRPYGSERSGEHGVRETTDTCHTPVALVFVGSGELEGALREQARGIGLRVIDRTDWKVNGREEAQEGASLKAEKLKCGKAETTDGGDPHTGGQAAAATKAEPRLGEPKSAVADEMGRLGDQLIPKIAQRQPPQEGDAGNRENGRPARLPSDVTGETPVPPAQKPLAEPLNSQPSTLNEENCGTVFFYGFRQIEENPVFYALAEAFVLPSLKEEWGLVVNEAMAAGLPVIVSRTAGCAEDLVPAAPASGSVEHGAWSMEEEADAQAARPYLEQRSNGFVFDPSSADALATALACVAVAGEKLKVKGNDLSQMGRRSRAIVAKFSCENFARQALRAAEAAGA